MTLVHLGAAGLDLRTDAFAPRVLRRGARSARVALVGARALLLAGDRVEIDVTVEAGCSLELVEVAGTVAYDGRGGEPSCWSVRIALGAGARLSWHGEPFVVASGADVTRDLHADLGAGAVARLRETLVLGRTGESGGALLSRTRVALDDAPLLVEDLDLRDVATRTSPAVLGANRCVDTISTFGERAEAPRALQLQGCGTLVRALTVDAHRSPLAGLWRGHR